MVDEFICRLKKKINNKNIILIKIYSFSQKKKQNANLFLSLLLIYLFLNRCYVSGCASKAKGIRWHIIIRRLLLIFYKRGFRNGEKY